MKTRTKLIISFAGITILALMAIAPSPTFLSFAPDQFLTNNWLIRIKGSGLTNVDAATLGGHPSTFFVNTNQIVNVGITNGVATVNTTDVWYYARGLIGNIGGDTNFTPWIQGTGPALGTGGSPSVAVVTNSQTSPGAWRVKVTFGNASGSANTPIWTNNFGYIFSNGPPFVTMTISDGLSDDPVGPSIVQIHINSDLNTVSNCVVYSGSTVPTVNSKHTFLLKTTGY